MNGKKKNQGFTLIEIMVVVIILGMLIGLVVNTVGGRSDEARITLTKARIGEVEKAVEFYKMDNKKYPESLQDLLKVNPKTEDPYLDPKDVVDMWDNELQYKRPGDHGKIDIWSYGADGKPGGSGVDTDISNWEMKKGPSNTGN